MRLAVRLVTLRRQRGRFQQASVTLAIALTTTTGCWSSRSCTIARNRSIAAASSIDVPPNFVTIMIANTTRLWNPSAADYASLSTHSPHLRCRLPTTGRPSRARFRYCGLSLTGICPRLADLGAYKCPFLAIVEVPKNTTTHSWIAAGRLKTLRLLLVYWPLQRATHRPTRIHMHMAIVLMRVRI